MEQRSNLLSGIIAALLGFALDVLGTHVSSFFATLPMVGILALTGRDLVAAAGALYASPVISGVMMIHGLSFTVLGSYATAKIARSDKLRYALAMGFLSVLFSLLATYYGPRDTSLNLAKLAPMALGLPAALGGGYLGSRNERRQDLPRIIILSLLLLTLLASAVLAIGALLLR